MTFFEIVKSDKLKAGKHFGDSPTGPWWGMLPDGSFGKRTAKGIYAPEQFVLNLAAYHKDTWQFEPEPRVTRAEVVERVDSCFKMLRDLILSSLSEQEERAT